MTPKRLALTLTLVLSPQLHASGCDDYFQKYSEEARAVLLDTGAAEIAKDRMVSTEEMLKRVADGCSMSPEELRTRLQEAADACDAATETLLERLPRVTLNPMPVEDPLQEFIGSRVLAIGVSPPKVVKDVPFRLHSDGALAHLAPGSVDTLALLEVPELMVNTASALAQSLKQAMVAVAPGGTVIVVAYGEEAKTRLQRVTRAAGYLDLKSRYVGVRVGGALILKR